MSNSYRRFLQLVKDWPLDTTKTGRDLGQHIRDRIKIAFGASENFPGDQRECDLEYLALKRLVVCDHAKKYPRLLNSSAIGLSAEECKSILSNEFLETLTEEDKGIISKIFSRKN